MFEKKRTKERMSGRNDEGKKSKEANELKHLISFINGSCHALWFYYLSWVHDCKFCVFAADFFFHSSNKLKTEINQLKMSVMHI